MRSLSTFVWLSFGAAGFLLAVTFGLLGGWAFAGAAIAVAALWAFGRRRGWMGLVSLGLFGMIGLAAFGLLQGLPALPVLLAGTLALAAWDLCRLEHRLAAVEQVENRDLLIQQHLVQLAGVCGAGLLVALAATVIRISLSFLAVFALGLLALWALNRLSKAVR